MHLTIRPNHEPLSRNLTDNSSERNELHIESSGLFSDALQLLVLVFRFVDFNSAVHVVLQPARYPMKVGCETAELSYRFCVPVRRYCHVVFCTSYINSRRMQIQRGEPFGCIPFHSILLSLTRLPCHIVGLPKVKFDGLGPVANRFYETVQRGRANWPKPVDCCK